MAGTSPAMTPRLQVSLALVRPALLVWQRQPIQVLRCRRRIVDPFPLQRATVDDIDREPAALVLVGEIAP